MFEWLSGVILVNLNILFLDAVHPVSVIWWTNSLYPHFGTVTKTKCPSFNCDSTHKVIPSNASNLAFIFYGTDFNPDDLPLPRNSNHIWTLLHEESPMNNYIFSHFSGIQLFNYTATFSRHSDFPLTTQSLASIEYLTQRQPIPTYQKNQLRKKGLAPLIYVQSHCNVASDRDRYIRKLMNYIEIDSYGECLHNKDLPSHINTTTMYDNIEFFDFIAQYKFHIAFENAVCDDYITEKFFRPLHVGSIPIYRGSPTAKDWEPSRNSVIFANDFKNPEDLAAFIKAIDENDALYDSYLAFKTQITNELLLNSMLNRHWGVNDLEIMDFIIGFECFVCEKAIESDIGKTANKMHMNCPQPRTSLDSESDLPLNDEWLKEDWVESYWFAFDQARAIQKMIKNKENDSSKFFNYLMEMKYDN